MEVTYDKGTAINLQDAARDLDARLSIVESNPLLKAEDLAVDLASEIKQEMDPLTDRVKALEDEIALLRVVQPTEQVSKTEWTPTPPKA